MMIKVKDVKEKRRGRAEFQKTAFITFSFITKGVAILQSTKVLVPKYVDKLKNK